MPKLIDTFAGDDAALVECIEALIELNDAGKLVPNGIGGHARKMLAAAAVRLTAGATDPVANFRQRLRQGAEAPAEVQEIVAAIDAFAAEQDNIMRNTSNRAVGEMASIKVTAAKQIKQRIAALATPQQGQEVEGWTFWDGVNVPAIDGRDSRKGFIWFIHETEEQALSRGISEIFYWPWFGEDEKPCVRAYKFAGENQ